jgi:hypothetical protein
MITDSDVSELYRCLLGRAPETPDTVAAFKTYYPDFVRGRQAILHSAEFARLMQAEQGDTGGVLAQAFLHRAGGGLKQLAAPQNPGLRGAMRLVLRAHGGIRLAVIAGTPAADLNDVLPLESGCAAVLHITAGASAKLPQYGTLDGGAKVFRIRLTQAELAAFLVEAGLEIDLLAVFGMADEWVTALQEVAAPRAILLTDGPIAAAAVWPQAEREIGLHGMRLRCAGGWFLPVTYAPPAEPPVTETIAGLCIAAIMRNEQEAAPNMLASVAAIADSFVIVDTGSTDDTVARTEATLQSIGKPYVLANFTADRFDDMRNAALDLVPPSTRWILMLDADEELCAGDHASLRALLEAPGYDAYALPRYNYTGLDKSGEVSPYPDRQVRLLRHRPENPIRYSGAVHETIRGVDIGRAPLDASVFGQGAGGPHIHHLVRRFRSPAEEAAKQDRYRRIAAAHATSTVKD